MIHNSLENIINKYREKRLSHAFLLETNDINRCYNELLTVIKNVICPEKFESNCVSECNLCNLVSKGTLPSIMTVEPDGASIKKDQVLDLKEKMLSKPLYSSHNMYIIKSAEKLTLSSANTMLKFLEEPNDQVIGFFITDNKENIINTIKSRCQIVNVLYNQNVIYDEVNLNEEDFNRYIDLLKEYLLILEEDFEETFLKNKSIVISQLNGRIEFENFLKLMLKVYETILNKQLGVDYNISQIQKFSFINEKNNVPKLIAKLKIIESILEKLVYNPNLELILDRLVIEMEKIS